MLLLSGLAAAITLSGPGDTLHATLSTEDGTEIAIFYAADGKDYRAMGWRADQAARREWIEITLPDLQLAPGRYRLVAQWPGRTEEQWIEPGELRGEPVEVVLSAEALGAVAWSMEGQDAWQRLAYAPAGQPLHLTPGRWQAAALGTARPFVEQIHAPTPSVRLDAPLRPLPRPVSQGRFFILLLLPAAILLAGLGVGVRKLSRHPGAHWLVIAAVGVGILGILPALQQSGVALLSAGGPIQDPEDSVALLASIIDGVGRLSDVGRAYGWPEGASWLTVGPSWLGYLPAGIIGAITDPLVGHNLGVGVGLAGLALATSLLARSHGLSLPLSIAAGAAAALCPAVIDEVDAISLDRATLYTTPLALLCLHHAVTRPGLRWPVAAGVAVAAGIYGQVYYGIFFAVVAPLLGGIRLLSAPPGGRVAGLGRLLLAGGVAAALSAPGLYTLRAATAGLYDDTAPLSDWRHPVTTTEASAFLSRSDRQELPMETAEQRLLTTTDLALSAEEAAMPTGFVGGAAWWGLAAVALLIARRRRGLVLLGVADVAILLLMSLGPFLKTAAGWTGAPLPHYLLVLTVPGFDQLKNVHRFALMAAVLAPIPLALGIAGLAERLPRGRRVAEWVLAGVLLVSLLRLDPTGQVRLSHPPRTAWYPQSATLNALPDAPAIALPMRHPTPRAVAVAAAQHGIPLVNPPPFEVAATRLTPWAEDNALLNRLAALSASSRVNRLVPAGDYTADLAALWEAGVRTVLLFPGELEQHEATAALLDRLLVRAGSDPTVIAWHLRPATAPAP
ncbi:MAG: hypothetical protein ACI8RZ_004140 [Myxococcota bacterium]